MRRPERLLKLPRIYTGGGRLPDGRALELIRDERDGLARFLLWNPRERTLERPDCIVQNHVEFFPVDDECWLRNVRLPTLPSFKTKLNELADRLTSLFKTLGEDQALLLAGWVLATWKAQELSAPPRLFVRGLGADSVLCALEAVCRRSVRMCAQSSTGTYPSALAPTLLVSVDSPRVAHKLLNTAVTSQLVWRGGLLVDQHTACAVAYNDDAKPPGGVLNILSEVDLDLPAAEEWQNELLGWKLLSEPALENATIMDPVLRSLQGACSGCESLAQRVQAAYERQQQSIQPELDCEEEDAVVAVLTDFVGEPRQSIFVAEIARAAEKWLMAHGSYATITPRHAGEVLRRLSIETVRLGALGRGIRLTADTLSRIKDLGDRAKPQVDHAAEAEGQGAQ